MKPKKFDLQKKPPLNFIKIVLNFASVFLWYVPRAKNIQQETPRLHFLGTIQFTTLNLFFNKKFLMITISFYLYDRFLVSNQTISSYQVKIVKNYIFSQFFLKLLKFKFFKPKLSNSRFFRIPGFVTSYAGFSKSAKILH